MARSEPRPIGFRELLRHDLPAGLVVFLVAVPLCLGIALASGAPLPAGLIAGMCGGLVVPLISRSALGVSGPAAGLTVIVYEAIQRLGFEPFLLAVVLAGLFQLLFGLLQLGLIGYYFPSAVISGMLAGIGIIVVLKQIPHAVGYDFDWEGDLSFLEPGGETTFSALLHLLDAFEPGAAAIAAVSMAILLLWERPVMKRRPLFQLIQGPLVAVVAGALLNLAFRRFAPGLALGPDHLVQLPTGKEMARFFTSPDWEAIGQGAVWTCALTLALVASIETLLSVEATDKLDPDRRVTPTNRELIAQGCGNLASGLLGGLPITQVIIRSSTNILAGAKTRASALFHGILLAVASLSFPELLNTIPLATLAAILISVGYKLARPQLFLKFYRRGWYQFIPFLATVGGLVLTNLLAGVAFGITVALFFILLEHYKRDVVYIHQLEEDGTLLLKLSEHVTFLNKASLRQALDRLPEGSRVILDGSACRFIDDDALDVIEDFRREARAKEIELILIGLPLEGSLPSSQVEEVVPLKRRAL